LQENARVNIVVSPLIGGIHKDILIHGLREPYSTFILLNVLKKLKKERKKVVVINIGANIGYYCAIEVSTIGEDGVVYAIEPAPVNLQFLYLNTKVLNDLRNVIIKPMAVGDRDDVLEFRVDYNTPNVSKVARFSGEANYKVRVKTLDTFAEEERIDHVDLIQMDVEGYEYRVIKGARKVLSRDSPWLFVEIHPSMIAEYGDNAELFLQELSSLGYKVKYTVWEPLTPTYLKIYQPPENYTTFKGSLDPLELMLNRQLRRIFLWSKHF